jgi:hypothetical protein
MVAVHIAEQEVRPLKIRGRVALRSSIAEVACRTDGCLPSGGRARSESVSASCAMVGWALSIELR